MLVTLRAKNLALLAVMSLLVACSSQQSEWKALVGQRLETAQQSLDKLQSGLSMGTIRNALLLKSYGDALKRQNPEMSEVVDLLVQDAKWDGPMVHSLQKRLNQAREQAGTAIKQGEKQVNQLLDELDAIADAASPVIYGLMLSDPINVIADMSNGTLGRIESMSKQASMQANNEKDYGAGSQLVGNPHYGSWQTNSSGQSIWAWYGMYAFFSNFTSRPIYYDDWAWRRPYSYYSDHGRSYYSSPTQRRSERTIQETTRKKFQQQGKTFQSPYAKNRTGGATTASVTQRASASRRASSYQRSRKQSSYSSSQRSSRYKTSRSFGGGK